MSRDAITDAPLIEPILERWSPRAFSDRPVSADDMHTLLEAARLAPSCKNQQPWRFVYAHAGTEGFDRLVALLDDWNSQWAPTAPVLMLTLAKKTFDDGVDNAHAWHDVGLAMGQLLVQATSMGLSAHQMAGFDWRGAPDALGLPDDLQPVAMVALGYVGDPSRLPEDLDEVGARSRKPLSEIAFEGGWPAE
jgi:nitroreductase